MDGIIKPGEAIQAGGVLARIHAPDRAQADSACARLNAAFDVTPRPPVLEPLIAGSF